MTNNKYKIGDIVLVEIVGPDKEFEYFQKKLFESLKIPRESIEIGNILFKGIVKHTSDKALSQYVVMPLDIEFPEDNNLLVEQSEIVMILNEL